MAGRQETRVFDSLLTTTLANMRDHIADNFFETNPLLSYFNGAIGKALRVGEAGNGSMKKVESGGESIIEQLEFLENNSIDSFRGGETINTDLQNTITTARFEYKQYGGTISIKGREKRANKGDRAISNLLKHKTNSAIKSMRKRLNEDAFGDGTGNGGRDIGGLQNLVSDTATTGAINPTTFPWWKAQVTSAVGSFAANGRAKMSVTFNNASDGNDKPDFSITTQAIYEFYETSLQAIQRVAEAKTGEAGFENLAWRGMPLVWDRDCPTGNLYFLNSKYMNWVVDADADFAISPFISPEDQDVTTAKIIFDGNITINNRRRLAVMTGITA